MIEHAPLPVDTLDGDQGVVALLLRLQSRANGEPKRVLATFEFRMTVIAYVHRPFTMVQRRIRDMKMIINTNRWPDRLKLGLATVTAP